MNLECNDEQWNFIFKYYPEYGSSPYQLITWLFGEAQKNEQFIAEQEGLYGKPEKSGKKLADDDDEPVLDRKYDKGFGPSAHNSRKKQ
jgi:hypothetical protein